MSWFWQGEPDVHIFLKVFLTLLEYTCLWETVKLGKRSRDEFRPLRFLSDENPCARRMRMLRIIHLHLIIVNIILGELSRRYPLVSFNFGLFLFHLVINLSCICIYFFTVLKVKERAIAKSDRGKG